jgi:hypothetical protein
MYEVTKTQGTGEIPKIQRFKAHSPFIVGAVAYFIEREGDGKMVTTSVVKAVNQIGMGVYELVTRNSVYEVREV